MCGINGIFAFAEGAAAVSQAELIATRDHMIRRGPDGFGEWVDDSGRIGFGHRRPSIQDLSERGAQPMHSADGQLTVTFNGEIYNYPQLRRELEREGVQFRSTSDTEVLLHLYQRDGDRMVERLRGMFAFGLCDARNLRLLLDPDGAHAAVMPRWCAALLAGHPVRIHGDGETSRDFCYVANAVQANLLAACTEREDAIDTVYNVAVGDRTSLNALFEALRGHLAPDAPDAEHGDFRAGDVRHSQADITKARERLGYAPSHDIRAGLAETARWHSTFAREGADPVGSSV